MLSDEIYIGIDLSEEYTQISFCDLEHEEPESVYESEKKETYMLSNILFYSENDSKWYVGDEALTKRFKEDGIIVENVIEQLGNTQYVIAKDENYSYTKLLEIMLKGHLDRFLEGVQGKKVKKIVISIYKYSKEIYSALKLLKKELKGICADIDITSHINSYLHYIFNQPEDLRNNSVGLFDFSRQGLVYYRMDKVKRGMPEIINIVKYDFNDITIDKVYENNNDLDLQFLQIVKDEVSKIYLSSIYLTGTGFLTSWARQSINTLCSGRRVFMGQNIYSKGAAYAAVSGSSVIEPEKFIICSEDIIMYDICINAGNENKEKLVPIVEGGKEWYNMRGRVEIFLDDTNQVEIVYRNRMSKEEEREVIEIHGLPKRPNKTTKLSLEVSFVDETNGAVVIKDKGFGKLYPTTNKIYRKEFSIEQGDI